MLEILSAAGKAWLRQAVGGLGPLFFVAFVLFWSQRWTQLNLSRVIGWRGVVFWTGWLGTPIHELSHWIVGKLLGVHILELKLFAPDERSGVLGYVRYRVPRLRLAELLPIVGTFLMGIAPLFGGALALYGVRLALIDRTADQPFIDAVQRFSAAWPTAPIASLPAGFFSLIVECYRPIFGLGMTDVWMWLYLYISLAIGTHLAPSGADLRGGMRGFLVVAILAYGANVISILAGADPTAATATLARVTAPMTTLLLLALALNMGQGAVAFGLALAKRLLP